MSTRTGHAYKATFSLTAQMGLEKKVFWPYRASISAFLPDPIESQYILHIYIYI